jgi:gluconate 5-dehydrogenase
LTSPLEALFGLRGQVAVVTGASSGLGVDAARALAKAGADVGLVARRADRLDALAAELARSGRRARAAPADVSDAAALRAALDLVEAELGPIEIAVHSAGVAPLGRAERHSRAKWDQAIGVNLTAAFELAQLLAERWIERGTPGRLVFVSSVMGRGANPMHRSVGYAASKGGLDNLVRQLAVEWARHGIRVNAIAPAWFATEMTVDPRIGDVDPEQRAGMEARTPLGRLGRPGEIETAILFLAAPGSTYVTGSIVSVDGGWTAW